MIRTNTQQYDILLYLLLPQSPTRPQCQPSCLEALSNLCPGFSSTRAYPKPSTGPPLPAGTEGIIIILNQVKRTKRITLNQVNNVSSKCFVNSLIRRWFYSHTSVICSRTLAVSLDGVFTNGARLGLIRWVSFAVLRPPPRALLRTNSIPKSMSSYETSSLTHMHIGN